MTRRSQLIACLTILAVACADPAGQAPTLPQAPDASVISPPPGCPTDLSVLKQIVALFPRGNGFEAITEIKFLAIRVAMVLKKPATAATLAYSFTDWTLKAFNANQLTGGKSAGTQAKVTALIGAAYCAAGLPVPTIPSGALGTDGAVALVLPSTSTTPTTLVTTSKFAGIQIPGPAVTQPTLITVSRIQDTLLTQLDKYPLNYEFHATPELPGNVDVVVGVCIADGLIPSDSTALLDRVRVAHNVPDPNPITIEILPLAAAPFLVCDGASLSLGPKPSLREFANWGLARAGRALQTIFAPAPLSASLVGGAGLGGTARKLSPFGVVDPLIKVTAASSTSLTGLANSIVSPADLPKVRVSTPKGHPVINYPVSFAVTAGSEGVIEGGAATTNDSGKAAVTKWTLGPSLVPNSVNASVAAPHLNSSVQGSPVLFTDNVIPPTSFSYLASGYRYRVIGSQPATPSDWVTGGEDVLWSTGTAAFGTNASDSPVGCPLNAIGPTTWPAAGQGGILDLLVHRSVGVPIGFTGSLRIRVAIDNDIQVFVNGTSIPASTGTPNGDGFMVHEGCATQDSFEFMVPNSILVKGASNLIAIRARDRGGNTYFDMEAVPVP